MDVNKLADEIISGRRLTRNDDISGIFKADITELTKAADNICRCLCGNSFELCSIVNGRSGRCSEDCKFCAQSSFHCTDISEYGFLDEEAILRECRYNAEKGVRRFSVVTAGRTLKGNDLDSAISAYKRMKKECGIELCASHGLLGDEELERLRDAGVTRYHCNIETSRRYFPMICTTHTFDDKIRCIKSAKAHGLEVCSGGIIGMGETWDDRLDMALTLSELEIGSVPLNVLNAIPGTPFGELPRLTDDEILRTVAIFRFVLPTADIRLAGGRGLMADMGRGAFSAGANAAITGDMLTTSGISIDTDKKMIGEIGYKV